MASTSGFPSRAPVRTLDLRGLHCPLPVLRTAKALRAMAGGERLLVLATDPLAVLDIPHFLREGGHRLAEQEERDGVLRFLVQKAGEQKG